MKRILPFKQPCRCRAAKRQRASLKAACEAIEADADRAIEFVVPSIGRLAGLLDDLDPDEELWDPPTVCFYIRIDADRVPVDSDLREYARTEMNRIADELHDAAKKLEGGAP